jgi:hypothetical protein
MPVRRQADFLGRSFFLPSFCTYLQTIKFSLKLMVGSFLIFSSIIWSNFVVVHDAYHEFRSPAYYHDILLRRFLFSVCWPKIFKRQSCGVIW